MIRLELTKQRSFPPVSISNFNVVIPAQTAFIQIHGGEVQNNLVVEQKYEKAAATTQKTHI